MIRLTRSDRSALFVASLRIFTMSSEVPAGAANPHTMNPTRSGKPDSAKVGTSGVCGQRLVPVEPIKRADQADVLGDGGQCRHHRERLDPGYVSEMPRVLHVVGGNARRIGKEQHVEQPALSGLRQLQEAREIPAGIDPGIRMPPSRDVVTRRTQEHAEFHLPGCHGSHYGNVLSLRNRARSDDGIAKLSNLAVSILMTISNFVACITGMISRKSRIAPNPHSRIRRW